MADINEFVAQVKRGGLSRTNRFHVLFQPPFLDPTQVGLVGLLCDQVQLPGTNYSTTQNRVFGEFRETPYERLYEPISMSFYVDRAMAVKDLFDQWMVNIQDPETRLFNYYSNYITDITVFVEDLENGTRYKVTMFEGYPKSVGGIQLDTSSKDVMKMNVSFVYKYYVTERVQDGFELSDEHISQSYGVVPDTPSRYSPDFTTNINSISPKQQNTLVDRLKNFAIGAIGAKAVTKIPNLLRR